MLDERTIFLGEKRRVTLDTWFINGAEFVLTNPTYEFFYGDMRLDSGELLVQKRGKHWLLKAMVEATHVGPHVLVFTYYLGDERIVRKLKINVRR